MPPPVPKARTFGPRLWNAKRRIDTSKGLFKNTAIQELKDDPFSEAWKSTVSQDVVEFVDSYEQRDALGHPVKEMLPEEKLQLLRSPARYFSRPHNVPKEMRKQMYFPDFTITLLRTPHLGPQFASFDVPLWFSKLDLKSYLENLYDVGVNHVRSFVIYQKIDRKAPTGKYQRGQQIAPPYKKKMTVQLVEPFIWPAEITAKELKGRDYEKNKYWDSTIAYFDHGRKQQEDFVQKPDIRHRRSIAEQARALLAGKEQWQPTWKQLSTDTKVLEGNVGRALISDGSAPSESGSPSLLR